MGGSLEARLWSPGDYNHQKVIGPTASYAPGHAAGLDLLPTWALKQQVTANRQVIEMMRKRLAAGETVARMYQDPGLAWLERQAEVGEDLLTERQRERTTTEEPSPA
jgi:hypothetical protein